MSTQIVPDDLAPDLSAKGIWQPLPRESSHAHAAFTLYLELGPDASLRQVAEKTGKSLDAICQLSSRHQWMERAAAYRHHVSQTSLAAIEHDRAKQAQLWRTRINVFREHQWEALQRMMIIHRQAGNHLLAKPDKEIAFYEFARLEDTICRMARATGVNADAEEPGETSLPIAPALEDSIQKVYGEPFEPHKYAHLLPAPCSESHARPAPDLQPVPDQSLLISTDKSSSNSESTGSATLSERAAPNSPAHPIGEMSGPSTTNPQLSTIPDTRLDCNCRPMASPNSLPKPLKPMPPVSASDSSSSKSESTPDAQPPVPLAGPAVVGSDQSKIENQNSKIIDTSEAGQERARQEHVRELLRKADEQPTDASGNRGSGCRPNQYPYPGPYPRKR